MHYYHVIPGCPRLPRPGGRAGLHGRLDRVLLGPVLHVAHLLAHARQPARLALRPRRRPEDQEDRCDRPRVQAEGRDQSIVFKV